jgi:hypothetical protein
MMVSSQKNKEFAFKPPQKNPMIIYSCLPKSSHSTARVLPINGEQGIPELKEIYAHVICGPRGHNEDVVCTVHGI